MAATESVEERNKAVIRRVFDEFVNRGDFSVVDEVYGAGMVDHQPLPGAPEGTPGVKYTIAGLREGFPDVRVTIEDISAHGDHVVIHNTWRGTHLGDFLGMAPTGRPVEFTGVVVWRLEEGLIVERWGIGVESNMLAELGMRRLAPAGKPRAGAARDKRRRVSQVLTMPPPTAPLWAVLQAELHGPRLREYEASRRRVGIVRESFQPDATGAGTVVHHVEARDPQRAGQRLSTSEEPFDSWLRACARDVFGVDPWAALATVGSAATPVHDWVLAAELEAGR
jgi:predicted ester cyclase